MAARFPDTLIANDASHDADSAQGRWIGWRLRLLVATALVGCIGIFMLASLLAATPRIDAKWAVESDGRVRLTASAHPELTELIGNHLQSLAAGSLAVPINDITMELSERWLSGDEDRADFHDKRRVVAAALMQGPVTLGFDNGVDAVVNARPTGLGALGLAFWVFASMALMLYMLTMVVCLASPNFGNALYGIVALCQTASLLLIGVETVVGLASFGAFDVFDGHARTVLDLVSCAALVHIVVVRPYPLPGRRWIAAAAWSYVALLVATEMTDMLMLSWWWTQASVALLLMVAVLVLSASYRYEPHPMTILLRRMLIVAAVTWLLLSISVAVTDDTPGMQHGISSVGSMIWYVYVASLLAFVPFVGQSKILMREFSLLAAISTIATSLDLLFIALFSLSQFASLTLSLFLSIGTYVGVRQWLLSHVRTRNVLATERLFERLYRTARAVEAHPRESTELLAQLLREMFEPLELSLGGPPVLTTRVEGNGAALRVGVPTLGARSGDGEQGSILMRFGHRGRHLFTEEDARLTDRIVEQLRRAVLFDQAVEQGRSEERTRLAQDLHDDIGARLLTLMYKASSPEMEDYVRHTLQDLKTLTRGLAAASHPLSHAAAEWKSDLAQRLGAARIALSWSVVSDQEIVLTVVQWSAITRIIRELVSNIIAHAQASQVDIQLRFHHDRLDLTVLDDGSGRAPERWAHGLGLGGIRKRARQLAGDVDWSERAGRGICCEVTLRQAWRRA